MIYSTKELILSDLRTDRNFLLAAKQIYLVHKKAKVVFYPSDGRQTSAADGCYSTIIFGEREAGVWSYKQ